MPGRVAVEVVAVNPKDLLGQQGEQLAAKFLTDAGLSVLGRNWRGTLGEIDIVGVLRAAPGEFSIEHVRGVG